MQAWYLCNAICPAMLCISLRLQCDGPPTAWGFKACLWPPPAFRVWMLYRAPIMENTCLKEKAKNFMASDVQYEQDNLVITMCDMDGVRKKPHFEEEEEE